MDQLSALQIIFKSNMKIEDGTAVINYDARVVHVDTNTMEVLDPEYSYIDVYDYILRCRGRGTALEKTETVIMENLPVVKITEEEFLAWKSTQQAEAVVDQRLTGRQLWQLMNTKKSTDD